MADTTAVAPPPSSRVPPAVASFLAGAAAGLIVDVGLFPIDTIKTRLQSVGGFHANGGFKDVYKGLGVVTMGSVPGGAVFFAAYDGASRKLLARIGDGEHGNKKENSASNIPPASVLAARVLAGSIGECSACLVRVPVELLKQRLQVGHHHNFKGAWEAIVKEAAESTAAAQHTAAKSSSSSTVGNMTTTTTTRFASPSAIARVLYRGYPITIFREVPFAMIQMPLYETLKAVLHHSNSNNNAGNHQPSPFAFVKGLAPGFISGGVSAVLTTPLDVTKTRIMTMRRCEKTSPPSPSHSSATKVGAVRLAGQAMASIVKAEGYKALFKGGMTRCVWISAGGALFFGTYEGVKGALA